MATAIAVKTPYPSSENQPLSRGGWGEGKP